MCVCVCIYVYIYIYILVCCTDDVLSVIVLFRGV